MAARLTSPDLLGPYGISTLGRGNPAFNPIGYHSGSVWSHDTAIGALGLALDGHGAAAASVLRALVDASSRFGYRLPELLRRRARHHRPGPLPRLLPAPGLGGSHGRRPGLGPARSAP